MAQQTDVLVVGAGPTGLVLALWLTRQGVGVRIVDKGTGPGQTSRAMAVQARTLELYRQLGLADAVVAAGYPNPTMNLWARGRRQAQLDMGDAGAEVTPYPFILVYPQDEHERLLVARLEALGVTVERQTELLSFEEKGDHVEGRLRLPDGSEQTCSARYLAGCDGAKSTIRHQIGAGFEGGTYRQVFYVADVQLSGLEPADEAHIALDDADFVAVMAYGNGQHRLIGVVSDERADRAETLTFDDVGHHAIESLGMTVEAGNWFSTYRVHHRVTDRFRLGRAFLLGDAAHVHSPAGGQGMNTGIADAINLAWKLAEVVKGRAPDALLDSYEHERKAFARKLVETTDKLFTFVTADGNFANFVRTRVAPLIASVAYKIDNVREFMFKMISQTTLNYHDSALSEGRAGSVQGGDRLPWVRAADNFGPLVAIGWQVHVYGSAKPQLETWCECQGVALHEFDWAPEHGKAGLQQGAAYLLRPDTYVALADPQGEPEALKQYFNKHGLTHAAA